MASKQISFYIGAAFYTLLFAGAGSGIIDRDSNNKCKGSDRWEEKVLIDDLATEVGKDRKVTTIEKLNNIRTDTFEIKDRTERQNIETQIYTIKNCFISEAIREADNDIHLVIEDGNGHSMLAEIPDPVCEDTEDSEWAPDFANARGTFLKYQDVYQNYRWTISGVLFIDQKHTKNPEGNPRNNIELHPVITLKKTGKKFNYEDQ